MKVFLSHQSADSELAGRIAVRLRVLHQIESYLDVVDTYLRKAPEDLAEHIRSEMGKCTQLLAVISPATQLSQWVPWEIGVATEKDFPLATFSGGHAMPPEFLRKWPYLRNDSDLDHYAEVSKRTDRSFSQKRATLTESAARNRSTQEFYRELRASLRQ